MQTTNLTPYLQIQAILERVGEILFVSESDYPIAKLCRQLVVMENWEPMNPNALEALLMAQPASDAWDELLLYLWSLPGLTAYKRPITGKPNEYWLYVGVADEKYFEGMKTRLVET